MEQAELERTIRESAKPSQAEEDLQTLFRCEGIRFDLTGNCNLRCPYCVNDFSRIHGNTLMTSSAFEKGLQLLPLLKPEGQLLFSCYFEPTLHPKLLEFLEKVPNDGRKLAGFTTNLGKPLGQEYFDRLSLLGLRFVNVSLDSMEASVFEEMRKGARLTTFLENLDRLVSALDKSPEQTELRFITVVSKRNLEEIPELIERCLKEYRPAAHEVRCIWITKEMESRPWMIDAGMSFEDFIYLRSRLADAPQHVNVAYDLPPNSHAYTPFPSRAPAEFERFSDSLEDPLTRRAFSVPESSTLLISSDGKVQFLIGEPEISIDLEEMPDSLPVMREILFLHNLNLRRSRLLQAKTEQSLHWNRLLTRSRWLAARKLKFLRKSDGPFGYLEDVRSVRAADGAGGSRQIVVSGWARNPGGEGPAREILVVTGRGRHRRILASKQPDIERFDVASVLSDTHLAYCGWSVELCLDLLGDQLPGLFELSAFALDPETRRAHPLGGATKVELPSGRILKD